MSTALVDRLGRRPLLAYSFYGTGLALGFTGLYFFLLEVLKADVTFLRNNLGFLPFTGIILSNIISTLGFQSLLFVVPAEIFPMNVKATALTSLNIFGGVIASITTLAYQSIKERAGLCGVFWIFAFVAFFGGCFVLFYVPETKGKSLEEIQSMLQGDVKKGEVISLGLNDQVEDEMKVELELSLIDKETVGKSS